MVDFLWPCGRRIEQESTGRYLPAHFPVASAAERETASARESQPAARNVARRRQPGAFAVGTKTQLGDELISRIVKNDFVETGLWCLASLGARKLFYGPINQVCRQQRPRVGSKRC